MRFSFFSSKKMENTKQLKADEQTEIFLGFSVQTRQSVRKREKKYIFFISQKIFMREENKKKELSLFPYFSTTILDYSQFFPFCIKNSHHHHYQKQQKKVVAIS